MAHRGCAGDRQHDRGALQEPGQGELRDGSVVLLRGLVQDPAGPGQVARRDWEPGDEADTLLGAVVEQLFGLAVGQVVEVLDRNDVHDRLSVFQLFHGDFGQADVTDLALRLQVLEGTQRLLGGDFRIDPVELIEVNGISLQPPQAHLDALAQILGPTDRQPLVRPLPRQTALGGDDHAVRIGRQSFADDVFGDFRAIGVRRVNEVDADLDGALQDAPRFCRVFRVAPDALAGDPHGAEAHAVDGQIAAECERAGGGSVG